jgi:hypothetical protein
MPPTNEYDVIKKLLDIIDKNSSNEESIQQEKYGTINLITLNLNSYNTTTGEVDMGDYFNNIQNATIINKSILENSFNKVENEYNEEVAKSLIQIAEYIEESGNISAGILFDNFNEELNKPQLDKSKIGKIWDGIEKTLPSIATISEIIAKLAPLF